MTYLRQIELKKKDLSASINTLEVKERFIHSSNGEMETKNSQQSTNHNIVPKGFP